MNKLLGNTNFLLRLGPAMTMILFGWDQLMRPQEWTQYIPDWVARTTSTNPESIMRMHALINVVLGLLLLSGWNQLAVTWITFFWWLSIIPFAFNVDWTIGVRDTAILVSSILVLLTLLRGK